MVTGNKSVTETFKHQTGDDTLVSSMAVSVPFAYLGDCHDQLLYRIISWNGYERVWRQVFILKKLPSTIYMMLSVEYTI